MTKSTVATLKIRPSIFDLIRKGIKEYEIRDSSLEGVDVICYLDSETGAFLGSFTVDGVERVGRSADQKTIERSGVDVDTFFELFPPASVGGPDALWVAKLQKPVDINDALGIG